MKMKYFVQIDFKIAMLLVVLTATAHSNEELALVKQLRDIIILVSPTSGGNNGCSLIKKLETILSSDEKPHQQVSVYEMAKGYPPYVSLKKYTPEELSKKRILVCGGDGSVGWAMSDLENLFKGSSFKIPPIAIIPLGTGNDLARAFGWGAGYMFENLCDILGFVYGEKKLLDRWAVEIIGRPIESIGIPTADPDYKSACKLTESEISNPTKKEFIATSPIGEIAVEPNLFNNYLSIGFDAEIAYEFEKQRQECPFNQRYQWLNFIQYALIGKKLYADAIKPISEIVNEISCRAASGSPKKIQVKLEGRVLLFLNISSYGGGGSLDAKPVGEEELQSDGYLNVMILTQADLMAIYLPSGIPVPRGTQIATCKTITFKILKDASFQMDGEAKKINQGTKMRITYHDQGTIVSRKDTKNSEKVESLQKACDNICKDKVCGENASYIKKLVSTAKKVRKGLPYWSGLNY